MAAPKPHDEPVVHGNPRDNSQPQNYVPVPQIHHEELLISIHGWKHGWFTLLGQKLVPAIKHPVFDGGNSYVNKLIKW